METESKKPSKLRRRHEHNPSGAQNGCAGANCGMGGFKPVHGSMTDDLFAIGVSDTRFSPSSPQGPDPYAAGVMGTTSERRLAAGRGPHGRQNSGHHTSSLSCAVPNGPLWSHMSAAHFPSVPSGSSDVGDFGAFDEEILAAAPPELSSRDLEAGANSMGFLIGDDGMEADQDQALKSLLDLARENLTLKQQLRTANQELSRLQLEQESQSRYWTLEEHHKFLEAIENFGPKDVKAIATFVGSRSATQVRTHAQKYLMKLAREKSVQSGNDAENGNSSSEATEEASLSSSMPRRACGPGPNQGRCGDDSLVPSKASSRSPLSSGDGGDAAEDSSQSRSSRGSSCGPRDRALSNHKSSETSGSDGLGYVAIKVESKPPPPNMRGGAAGGGASMHQRGAAARGGRKRSAAQAEGPASDDEPR